MLVPIADPSDPRLAPYLHVRDRDIAGREDGFIAEGEVVLRVLARSPHFRPRSILVSDRRLTKLAPVLELFDPDVPVLVAPQAVMDLVVGFPIHRGVLAFADRGADPTIDAVLASAPDDALVLFLIGVSNHDNVGGLFRNAAAFGAHAVVLDGASCDPLYRKAVRVSVGGALLVPFARVGGPEEALAAARRHGFQILALSPGGAADLGDLEGRGRIALFLGAEGPGLPEDVLAAATTVRIAMAEGFDSLNVAVAGAIALHHLRRTATNEG